MHVAYIGEKSMQSFSTKKPEGRRLFGRSRRRWENNTKGSQEMELEGVDWIYLAQNTDQ
jgi:hypothetical protein